MELEIRENIIRLYDLYQNLLTEKQRLYFEDYYFSDLSLQEIAENNNVSRNAVHNSLKDIVNKLNYYEEKLKLIEKRKNIEKILDKEVLKKIEEYI